MSESIGASSARVSGSGGGSVDTSTTTSASSGSGSGSDSLSRSRSHDSNSHSYSRDSNSHSYSRDSNSHSYSREDSSSLPGRERERGRTPSPSPTSLSSPMVMVTQLDSKGLQPMASQLKGQNSQETSPLPPRPTRSTRILASGVIFDKSGQKANTDNASPRRERPVPAATAKSIPAASPTDTRDAGSVGLHTDSSAGSSGRSRPDAASVGSNKPIRTSRTRSPGPPASPAAAGVKGINRPLPAGSDHTRPKAKGPSRPVPSDSDHSRPQISPRSRAGSVDKDSAISDDRSISSSNASSSVRNWIHSSFANKISATSNNLFAEPEEDSPSLANIAKDAPSVTSQRSHRSSGSSSFRDWVSTSFSRRGSGASSARFDWVAHTDPVPEEKPSGSVTRFLRRLYQIIQANEAMFLIFMAILLAKAWPRFGSKYFYPDITSTWIAVVFIFRTFHDGVCHVECS
jgi:hypothetical protein